MDAITWSQQRNAQCEGKEPFSTPQLAAKVSRRRARVKEKGRRSQQVYRCGCCGLFHIGTKPKSVHASTKRARTRTDGDDADMA